MDHLEDFKRLLQQIMSKNPEPTMSPEKIHFDRLAMEVMELVGDKWMKTPSVNRGLKILIF